MASEKPNVMRRTVLVTLLLVGGVILFIVVLWIIAIKKPVPPAPERPEPFKVEVVSRASSSAGSTKKWVFAEDQTAYSLVGRFVSPLRESADGLQGTFVIDQDPKGIEIAVNIVSGRDDGLFPLALYRTPFEEGQMEVTLVTLEKIQESISPDKPVELRFMYHSTVTPTAEEESLRAVLEALLSDQWTISTGLLLTPVGIGITQT